MKSSLAVLGLAALAIASDVHDLTKETFEPFVQENDLVLAEFFAPWCGHCKALAPEYEEAATSLASKSIRLAKIDCTEQQDLCQDYGVEGYPTLKVFRGPNNVQPYAGPRKAQAIVSYMTKQSLPSVSLLQSSEALEEFKTADKVVLVGFFGSEDKSSNTTFSEVADELRDSFLFGATSDAALAKAEGVKVPAIVLYKTFDEGKSTFEEAFTTDAVTEFAKTASTPLIGEVGPETYAGYMAAGIPLAYIFSDSPEERASLAKTLKSVAEKQKGKVNFATIDAKAFGSHAGNLNLEADNWPAFAIQDIKKNQKFPYSAQGSVSDLSEKKIGAFVDDFVAGKVEPSVKSEAVPEKQEGPVTVVVAKNYQEVVIDSDKDVLLEYYAPWCGHCKALAPKYDELASMFKSHSDKIVIAKVDATLNDVPDEIQGFPTIKLFKAGAKDAPVDYSGSRTVEDLANFIRDSGSFHIDVNGSGSDAQSMEGVETEGMPHQAAAATKSASDASSAATDGASSVSSGASEGASSASSAATEGASSVSSGATEAASGVSEAAETATKGMKEKVMSVAGAVKVALLDDDDEIGEHDEL